MWLLEILNLIVLIILIFRTDKIMDNLGIHRWKL